MLTTTDAEINHNLCVDDVTPSECRPKAPPRRDMAYYDLRREVRLKGFRPGKGPRHVGEQLYRQKVEHDVAQELVEATIGQAIEEKQIQPVAPLEVAKIELKPGEPLRFRTKVEIKSQVEPKGYTGVELKRRPVKLDEEQVPSAVEGYRKRLTEYKPIEGRTHAQPTDLLMIEVHGRVGDNKIKRNNVGVDLEDKDGGPLPGLSEHLQGVALHATELEGEPRPAAADDGGHRRSGGDGGGRHRRQQDEAGVPRRGRDGGARDHLAASDRRARRRDGQRRRSAEANRRAGGRAAGEREEVACGSRARRAARGPAPAAAGTEDA